MTDSIPTAPRDPAPAPAPIPVSDSAVAHPAVARARRRWPARMVAAAVAAGLVVAGLGVGGSILLLRAGSGHGAQFVANQRPTKLPAGPPVPSITIAASDGRTLTCPNGSIEIMLSAVKFTPQLVDGTLMGKGQYRIKLHGIVANDTPQPITVHGILISVDGTEWRPKVTVAGAIPAQSSVPLDISGSYRSRRSVNPNIHTEVGWTWQHTELQPCGDLGLVKEH